MHLPLIPSWHCAGCGDHWPCATKRRQLLAEFEGAPTSLFLLMAARHADAAGDLRNVTAGALYERFLGWVRAARGTEPGN